LRCCSRTKIDAAWESVRLEQAPLDTIYNNQAAIIDSLPFEAGDNGLMKRGTVHVLRRVLRGDERQHLPLRYLSAHPRRHPPGSKSALKIKATCGRLQWS
jgi:hypothetical protein